MIYNFLYKIYKFTIRPFFLIHRDFLSIRNLKKNFRRIKHKKEGLPITVGFLLQFPEMWSSFQSVYDFLSIDAEFKVFVIAVPKKSNSNRRPFVGKNEAFLFCKEKNIRVIEGIVNGKPIDLANLNIDYLFVERAYDEFMPKPFSMINLQKHALLCYISYSGRITKGFHISIEFDNLYRYFHLLFSDCTEVSDYVNCKTKKKRYSQFQDVLECGFPRFDLIKSVETSNQIRTILWTPRWCLDEKQGMSHFYDYVFLLMDFFSTHKDLKLIIRPHPLMFSNFIKTKFKTEEEIRELKKQIGGIGNIIFDDHYDYHVSFETSDMLISDESSLLLEYFFTNKPVIMCTGRSSFNDYTKMFSSIVKTYYIVKTESELQRRLTSLVEGLDEKSLLRKNAMSAFQNEKKAKVCEAIAKALLDDYAKIRT